LGKIKLKGGLMEDWKNSILADSFGDYTDQDWEEGQAEMRELRTKEAEEILRMYYDNISFAKGKEILMARSAQEAYSDPNPEVVIEWIKKGWTWYDEDEDEWLYSSEGRKQHQEYLKKIGLDGMPDRIIL
jgi:hypothetical protein